MFLALGQRFTLLNAHLQDAQFYQKSPVLISQGLLVHTQLTEYYF